jgi:hypothetical protein
VVWFIKKLGKVFKLQCANFRMVMLGMKDRSTCATFPLTDKLLYERSNVVKFLSFKSLSSCSDPVILLEEISRTESDLSCKTDIGKGPDRLFLKLRVYGGRHGCEFF